eukprot:CAMPEP_0116116908 /NCGR_PEP_ID=MMETSP0329-20121206/1287_1 /TAXON_ID=697910 /ORGANISM="Pseudo-nitzschia arenysensis, Strain B593" /LENGTH=829 /DNA_ID=CAMNT_0003610431 /DNA_START=127 /DNA_END=2616 /DNA_ORIENTATION=+
MTAKNISLDHDDHGDCFYRVEPNENGRNRKRRRPQHEQFQNSSPLTSRANTPTGQETQESRYSGRRKRPSSSSLFWLMALVFVCCPMNILFPLVVAKRTGERTKDQTAGLKENHRRFLQDAGNSASVSAPSLDYLELPTSLWTSKDDNDQFLKGNAIRVSPFDKDILYATNQAGQLRVISATNGKSIESVSPAPRTLTEDGTTSTWSIYSKSGMSFGSFPRSSSGTSSTQANGASDGDGYNDYLQFLINNGIDQNNDDEKTRSESHFAVYSIVDLAPASSRFLPKTRVVCVSIPEHEILWTSAGLPGTPNGSPLVYYVDEATMGGDDDNMFIVLTHNSVLKKVNNETSTTGHLTVLDPSNGHVKWTQSEWSRDEVPKGYGPPQVSHKPVLGGGNAGGSPDNKNDVIVWTSSEKEGRGKNGNLYSFQMKSSSELEEESRIYEGPSDPFAVRVLKQVRWNSIAQPVVNQDGTSLFVAVTGNAVRGWNGIAKFNETANWSNQLVPMDDDLATSPLQPYPSDIVVSTAPVLSADEQRLFLVTVRNETVCLDPTTGVRKWAAKTSNPSLILSEPKASPDNQRLYVVNSEDGKLHGIDQISGRVFWTFGCGGKNLPSGNKCSAPTVHANFDLSYDGSVLYFVATDGRVAALTLGNKVDEEDQSTSTIVTIEFDDDGGPFEFDRKSNVGSLPPANAMDQKVGLKIAGTVVAILVSLAVAMISVMYVVRNKGFELRDLGNYRLPRYGQSKEKRHSHVTRLDGPDNYEDQIIARLSEDEGSIEQQFNTLWVDPTHSDPKYYVQDDESPTADRLSILLGTSNRIAPISDNFGFGQAVLI